MGEIVLNCGHRDYGYKNLLEYKNVLLEYGIPEAKLKFDFNKLKHYYKKAAKYLLILEIAFLALGVDHVFASPQGIDLAPFERFSNEIWLTMLKALLYISVPIFAWVGYIIVFAGTNGGKRTAAKVVFFSLVGGIAFVAGAPWAGNQIIGLCRRAFGV